MQKSGAGITRYTARGGCGLLSGGHICHGKEFRFHPEKMESRGGILRDLHFRDHWIYGGWAERGKEQRQLRITVGETMKA